jgi:hypothetical protein
MKLIEQQDYRAAFSLAKRARQYIPKNPTLIELWPRMCKDYAITTNPTGASIFYREHSATEASWKYLGQSPLENITLPQGLYRWKIEKEGFATHECVTDRSFEVRLREEGPLEEMVWIGAWKCEIPSSSSDQTMTVEVPSYLIDKYEVTNRQFKEFVDKGGYEYPQYWKKLKFLRDDHELSWEQAMNEFLDKTGQPGPSTWEGGTYPEGQGKYPVSGVS